MYSHSTLFPARRVYYFTDRWKAYDFAEFFSGVVMKGKTNFIAVI